MEEVSTFINAAHLYLRIKMTDETASNDPGSLGAIICAGRSSRGIEGQPVG